MLRAYALADEKIGQKSTQNSNLYRFPGESKARGTGAILLYVLLRRTCTETRWMLGFPEQSCGFFELMILKEKPYEQDGMRHPNSLLSPTRRGTKARTTKSRVALMQRSPQNPFLNTPGTQSATSPHQLSSIVSFLGYMG